MLTAWLRTCVRQNLREGGRARALLQRHRSGGTSSNGTFDREFDPDDDDDDGEALSSLDASAISFLKKLDRYNKRSVKRSVDDQRVFVIQPIVNSHIDGDNRSVFPYQQEEAVGLVEAATDWKVVGSRAVRVRRVDADFFFRDKALKQIRNALNEVSYTHVMINCSMLNATQQLNLEALWRCDVLDRYTTVLNIFSERAHTREAILQVSYAGSCELPRWW